MRPTPLRRYCAIRMRHLGLMFLTRGATYPGLPPQFARPAALGDLVTAALAFVSIFPVLRGAVALPGEDPEPYERLLEDALKGDRQLFAREDSIEQTWRVVQPLLDAPGPVDAYARGSWGPDRAKGLVRGVCEWYEPWLP